MNKVSNILPTTGNWYKGNLHTHTLLSDGRLSPESVLKIYRDAQYDFLALTDHWVVSQNGAYGDMLLLSGCEWDCGDMIHSPVFHIVGVGMQRPAKISSSPSLSPQQIIDAINETEGAAILAHPTWSVTNPADCMKLTGLCGMEIYNSISGLPWNGDRADASLYFDILATQGKFFRAMAADDSHYYQGEQTRSYILVNSPECSMPAILEALKAGNFYATQGPRFYSIELSGNTIDVECSDVETIVFYSNSIWCSDRVFTGGLGFASYQIKEADRYVRIELIDSAGKKAWSSPIPISGENKQ